MLSSGPVDLHELQAAWQARWPDALRCWSPYTQLREPYWCTTIQDEREQGLTGSFAMIRLVDHRVIVSLRKIVEMNLQAFAAEILAHEIGHHVYCPADLSDNARLLARLRVGLPTREHTAVLVGNLYTDLLINDRLQRTSGLSIDAVYRQIAAPGSDDLWNLYMRTYELLWQRQRGTLCPATLSERIHADAQLAARLVRSYARDWLAGAGRFAALCLQYLPEPETAVAKPFEPWHDTREAGKGGLPDGLAEADGDEITGAIHPSEDPDLSGLPADPGAEEAQGTAKSPSSEAEGGIKSQKQYRGPVEYTDLIKAAAIDVSEQQIVARYYREMALPHLVPFPSRPVPQAIDPLPEALDVWDAGQPLEDIDWIGTVTANPVIIPGITTRRRLYGSSPGHSPEALPVDLYLGVDCSGSMGNPAQHLSYPVLAGAVIALSALRAGARVMVALSGEPGRTITTEGFTRNESQILLTLTSYLGTGTTFGIHRLHNTFSVRKVADRPVHILIITDNDIFAMLDAQAAGRLGWDVARQAAAAGGGGATYVLQLPAYLMNQARAARQVNKGEGRMIADGWTVAHVDSMEELLAFARRFSRANYDRAAAKEPRHGT